MEESIDNLNKENNFEAGESAIENNLNNGQSDSMNSNNNNKKSLSRLLIIIVVIILILGVGLGVVYFLNKDSNDNSNNNQAENEQDMNQGEVVDDTGDDLEYEGDTNTADWKSYENENLNFSIKYPENWKIQVDEIEDENPENGEKIYGIDLELSYMGSVFNYYIPGGGFGGQKCVYGDEEFDGPQIQFTENYKELLKGEDRFRRAEALYVDDNLGKSHRVCQGDNDFYGDVVYDGFVSYKFTGSISEDMLDLMDQIFLSLEVDSK